MVSCTCAVEAPSRRAISGSDGRYMSVVSGPIALSAASNAVSAKVPGRSMIGIPKIMRRLRHARRRAKQALRPYIMRLRGASVGSAMP